MLLVKEECVFLMELTKPLPPQEDDFEALKVGLTSFNESFTGPVHSEKVSVFVKDSAGNVKGGILGEVAWNWVLIQGLWVDESIRNQGWGSKLLSEIEAYALAINTPNIRLETTTFQALDFYINAGYSIFGELDDMPLGHTCYFLKKQQLLT